MTEPRSPDAERRTSTATPEGEIAHRTRTLVIGPYATRRGAAHAEDGRTPAARRAVEARLSEAVGLARAIELDVVIELAVPVAAPRPATFLGSGKVEELKGAIAAEDVGLVVMECALTPVQQRNLERAWSAKVLDRTGLILEIFGRRARTREGSLQVELAHLGYQKSRLVRSWTHLERQRGGFGFLGGPGETQIEADRRVIQDRIRRIEKDLEGVKQTRALHRKGRDRVPYPTVALVGYTNAGKSTLFNRMTDSAVLAEDMLFATLDPTARVIRLPHGAQVILSDTVGFISDLPTTLVAAFRATLEDVVAADVLLHVRDVAASDSEAEAADVEAVLRQLDINPDEDGRIVEVWNKADLLDEPDRERLGNAARLSAERHPVLASAMTGEGLDMLLAEIERCIARGRHVFHLDVAATDGEGLAWLYEEAEIVERRSSDDGATEVTARIAPEKEPRLLQRFPAASRVS